MSKTLPLLRGTVTLESALESEDNMLQKIAYPEQRIDFFLYILKLRKDIEAVVSYHLGVGRAENCRMGEVKEWIVGSFNVCIPIYVDKWPHHSGKRVLIRFPLPYRVGELQCPGNADEKLRCEAATFLWLQDHCPAVPIPYLWGFGFPGGRSFTSPENVPFYSRLTWSLRRTILSWLGYPVPSRYVGHSCPRALGIGYLLMDYVEETDGKMLAESWEQSRHDETRRTNLFRDLSRIMLSMSQRHLPCIGSLTLDDQGISSLTNRPLTYPLHVLENEGIPTNIDRNLTYTTTESYCLDLLAYHDSRLRHQPNSINNEFDGRAQMAALTIMRALHPHFFDRKLRQGPFVFTFTDLHQSNIFVDEDWHVTCLVDLEWACSMPIETIHPPYWLTSRALDQLQVGEHLEAYQKAHDEFMNIFEEEEKSFPATNGDADYRTHIIRKGWRIGNFWYFQSLETTKGFYSIFVDHIQPRFETSVTKRVAFDEIAMPYWCADASDVVAAKLADMKAYEDQLRKAFEAVEEPSQEDSNTQTGN